MLALAIDAHPLHAIRGKPTHLGIVGIAVQQDGELDGQGVTVIASRRFEQDGSSDMLRTWRSGTASSPSRRLLASARKVLSSLRTR